MKVGRDSSETSVQGFEGWRLQRGVAQVRAFNLLAARLANLSPAITVQVSTREILGRGTIAVVLSSLTSPF